MNGDDIEDVRSKTPESPAITSKTSRSSKKLKSITQHSSTPDNTIDENQPSIEAIVPKSSIDENINELYTQLPPIDKTALLAWRKSHSNKVIYLQKNFKVFLLHNIALITIIFTFCEQQTNRWSFVLVN